MRRPRGNQIRRIKCVESFRPPTSVFLRGGGSVTVVSIPKALQLGFALAERSVETRARLYRRWQARTVQASTPVYLRRE